MRRIAVKLVKTAKRAYVIGLDAASLNLYETLKEKGLILSERRFFLLSA